MILLKQMMVLFILMLVGICCRKCGIFNDESNKRISALVLNVANPALVLSSGINQESAIGGMEFVKTFVLAWAMFGVLMLIAYFIPMILKAEASEYGIYRTMTIFSNVGFMGFPVIAALFGTIALLYASLFLIPFNVLIYTYGISVMKGEKSGFRLRKILNVGVVSCVITLFIYLTKLPIPIVIENAVDSVSGLAAPLSMMIIGDSLTKVNLKKLFCNARMLVFSGIKLLVIPLAGVSVIKLLGLNPMLTGVCMVMLSTPVGSMNAMLAQQYGGDYELASQGVTITTLLAVVTMPLVSFLLKV
ncbi:MAG: AEC family transporter [Lachnospiraceae bacterium]|nr:AEC family transporter [Lachnospiraceae bacterium]